MEVVQGYRTETLSSVYDVPAGVDIDPMPSPTPAHIFYASNRRPRRDKPGSENITVEVEAKEVSFVPVILQFTWGYFIY